MQLDSLSDPFAYKLAVDYPNKVQIVCTVASDALNNSLFSYFRLASTNVNGRSQMVFRFLEFRRME